MRRGEREAWTAWVEGREAAQPSKYGNERAGKYASKHEAEVASYLAALESRGLVRELREQVPFELVPKNGKLRAVRYVADFTYWDVNDLFHVLDAKGFKTQIYRLKKRLMQHVHNITVEEV